MKVLTGIQTAGGYVKLLPGYYYALWGESAPDVFDGTIISAGVELSPPYTGRYAFDIIRTCKYKIKKSSVEADVTDVGYPFDESFGSTTGEALIGTDIAFPYQAEINDVALVTGKRVDISNVNNLGYTSTPVAVTITSIDVVDTAITLNYSDSTDLRNKYIVLSGVTGLTPDINGKAYLVDDTDDFSYAIFYEDVTVLGTPGGTVTVAEVSATDMDVTTAEEHGLEAGETVKISYDDRIRGFNKDISGTFTIGIVNTTKLRISTATGIRGTFSSAGAVEAVARKTLNFYIGSGKTVEVVFKDGRKRLTSSIQGATEEAYATGGSVEIHDKTGNYDESTIMRTGVHYKLSEGVIIDNTTSNPTFYDNAQAVSCVISGKGIIKQTNTSGISAIRMIHASSQLIIDVDEIEGKGGSNAAVRTGSTIDFGGAKLVLTANRVYNQRNNAIYMSNTNTYSSIKLQRLETGIVGQPTTGADGLITCGTCFFDIENANLYNGGSIIKHTGGTAFGKILYGRVTHNNASWLKPAIWLSAGYLTLDFNEIGSYTGSQTAQNCIQGDAASGILRLRGLKVYTSANKGVYINSTCHAYINITEITSATGVGVELNAYSPSEGRITVENSRITGTTTALGDAALVVARSTATFVDIINSEIINLGTNANSHALVTDGGGVGSIVFSGVSLVKTHASAYPANIASGLKDITIKRPCWQNAESPNIFYNGQMLTAI
jgi:hypothetical protein